MREVRLSAVTAVVQVAQRKEQSDPLLHGGAACPRVERRFGQREREKRQIELTTGGAWCPVNEQQPKDTRDF